MKRSFLALMLAVLFVLAGCSGTNTPDGDHLRLSIMGRKSDLQKSYLATIFKRYEQATGNEIELIAYEDADFEVKAAEQFASGKVPDVFMHFHNADLARFDVESNFMYLNDEPWVNELSDAARAYCLDKDGDLLGLPFWESSVSGCYYNKTILDSLGLQPAETQAEFDMLCSALSEIGYTPICWPADGCSWMYQFGLDPIFADDAALLEALNTQELAYADIPAVSAMVQWIADAADRGWFGDNFLEQGWDDVSTALGQGEAVMTFIWDTWFYTDLEPDQRYGIDDFALMPVFMNTVDGGTYEGGNLNMMMVNKNGKNLDAALDFLSFCATPQNYNAAFEGISTVSCFKGQNTNIQSPMVTNAAASIERCQRVSTAATRILGYSDGDVAAAFNELFRGNTDVQGCVALMDEYRLVDSALQAAASGQDVQVGPDDDGP